MRTMSTIAGIDVEIISGQREADIVYSDRTKVKK
jgi:exopolyphosphatase/pppGpp-phosphohydrolase